MGSSRIGESLGIIPGQIEEEFPDSSPPGQGDYLGYGISVDAFTQVLTATVGAWGATGRSLEASSRFLYFDALAQNNPLVAADHRGYMRLGTFMRITGAFSAGITNGLNHYLDIKDHVDPTQAKIETVATGVVSGAFNFTSPIIAAGDSLVGAGVSAVTGKNWESPVTGLGQAGGGDGHCLVHRKKETIL